MFLHVVMLQLSGAADARFHDRVQGYCDRILAECDGVAGYAFRPNLASRADGLTHAVVAAFTDAAARPLPGVARPPGNEGSRNSRTQRMKMAPCTINTQEPSGAR
ncbi:hypothetical protein ACOTED_21125 [Achromobacter xylosoxidans]